MLKKEVSELVALEIVDETSTSIVCRNFVNMSDVNVENLVRRMDNIVRSMLHDLPSALANTEADPLRAFLAIQLWPKKRAELGALYQNDIAKFMNQNSIH